MIGIEDFKIESVPHHAIIAVATSEPAYEMDRTLIAKDWNSYGDFIVIEGCHCSCYDFDETRWSATKYTEEELLKVLNGWKESGYGSETLIVPIALAALGKN